MVNARADGANPANVDDRASLIYVGVDACDGDLLLSLLGVHGHGDHQDEDGYVCGSRVCADVRGYGFL